MSTGGIGKSQIQRQTTLQVRGQASGTYKSAGGAQRTVNVGGSGKTFHAEKRAALYAALNHNRSIEVKTVENNHGTVANSGSGVNAGSIFGALTTAGMIGLGIANMAKGAGGGKSAARISSGLGAGAAASVSFDSVNNMENAKDIASLREAISNATKHKGELSQTLAQLKPEYEAAQTQKTKLEDSIKQNKTKLEAANKKKSEAEGTVKGKTDKLSQAKDNLTNITGQKDSAIQKYAEAKGATQAAQAAFNSAESAWNAVKDKPTIPDPNDPNKTIPNPEYEPAKSAFEKAKQDLQQAQQAESQAKEARDEMMKQFETCKQSVENAEKMVADAKKELETAKKEAEEVKKEVEELTKEQQKLESDLKQQNGIISNYEKQQAEVAALDKALPQQQKRLDKMVADENKNNEKLDKRQDRRNNFIDQRNKIGHHDPCAKGFENTNEGKFQASFNDKTDLLNNDRMDSWNRLSVESAPIGSEIDIRGTKYTKVNAFGRVGLKAKDASGIWHVYTIEQVKNMYLE